MTTYALESLKTYLESMGYENIDVDKENKYLAFNAFAERFSFVVVINSFVKESNYIRFTVMPTKSDGNFVDLENFPNQAQIMLNMLLANTIDDTIGRWSVDGGSISWNMTFKTLKNWSVELDDVKEVFGIIYDEVVMKMNEIFLLGD